MNKKVISIVAIIVVVILIAIIAIFALRGKQENEPNILDGTNTIQNATQEELEFFGVDKVALL